MNKEEYKEIIKKAFKVCRVWKEADYNGDDLYAKGWNACIEKQKENEKNLLEFIDDFLK